MYGYDPNGPRYSRAAEEATAARLRQEALAAQVAREQQAAAAQAERDRENAAARKRRQDAETEARATARAAAEARAAVEADTRFAAEKIIGMHEWLAAHPDSNETEYLSKSWPHRRAALLAQERQAQFEATKADIRRHSGF